jgi:hypothetical protein
LRHVLSLFVLSSPTLLSACAGCEPEAPIHAVQVSVVDADGQPVTDAIVTFDGGLEEREGCRQGAAGVYRCGDVEVPRDVEVEVDGEIHPVDLGDARSGRTVRDACVPTPGSSMS